MIVTDISHVIWFILDMGVGLKTITFKNWKLSPTQQRQVQRKIKELRGDERELLMWDHILKRLLILSVSTCYLWMYDKSNKSKIHKYVTFMLFEYTSLKMVFAYPYVDTKIWGFQINKIYLYISIVCIFYRDLHLSATFKAISIKVISHQKSQAR